MRALYRVAEIRAIEERAAAGLPAGTLMRLAGRAAADAALALLPADREHADVLVLAGPGNNGGDGCEAARLLAEAGCRVALLLAADPGRQPDDAREALQRARESDVRVIEQRQTSLLRAGDWSLVVDALFGIGLSRPIDGPLREVVDWVNTLRCPVLALDVPSGLDADTGMPVGDGPAVHATDTVTFLGDKPGLHTGDGQDCAGRVHLVALDVDPALLPVSSMLLNAPALFAANLPHRRRNSHKGSFGHVTVLGGARGMAGAVVLAARAALLAGAGKVSAAFLENPPPYDGEHPELMCGTAGDADFSSTVIVAGPGLGRHHAAQDMLARALERAAASRHPTVLDADALNLIAAHPRLQQQVARRGGGFLMTPHPLEAARLLMLPVQAVQANRLAAARRLAERFQAVIVLKGSGTVIASPKLTAVNPTGNPALASGGTGDALAGICGALLAQGMPPMEAALAGVWLHGAAADALVERGIGPAGVTASELLPEVRRLLNQMAAGAPAPAP